MYFIYIPDGIVCEIIPEETHTFPDIPIAQRYSPEFLSYCVQRLDVNGIRNGMTYDPVADTFTEPPAPDPAPEPHMLYTIIAPSPLELTQQDLTALDLSSIEQGQTITDLELQLLEVQAHV